MRMLINLLFFQIVWFATVYGPGTGLPWLGVPAIAVFAVCHFLVAKNLRADALLVAIAVLMGLIVETVFVELDVIVYAYNLPFATVAPYWILILWANFALTINTGLRWLHGHYLAAALLGFVGAPIAYFGGVQLGAGRPGIDPAVAYVGIGFAWAVVTPILVYLGTRFIRSPD
jgi:hypothetical protein